METFFFFISIVDSIFELVDPVFHHEIRDLQLSCITDHCINSQQNRFQPLQECLIEISVLEKVNDQGNSQPVQQHLNQWRKACPSQSPKAFSQIQKGKIPQKDDKRSEYIMELNAWNEVSAICKLILTIYQAFFFFFGRNLYQASESFSSLFPHFLLSVHFLDRPVCDKQIEPTQSEV